MNQTKKIRVLVIKKKVFIKRKKKTTKINFNLIKHGRKKVKKKRKK